MSSEITLLFFGDLVGKPGVALFQKWAPVLKKQYRAHGVIVNGENAAPNGRGLNNGIVDKLLDAGANLITTGNHVWAQKESGKLLASRKEVIRPINFPTRCPGMGYGLFETDNGHTVAIMNAQGRIFMHEKLSCPFQAVDSALLFLKSKTNIIFLDFHAEATSEKLGMGYYCDGKLSGVFGTHTHVQTSDERIMPEGTSYITDLGCAGAKHSLLGMKKEIIIQRFLTQMPVRFAVETEGPFLLHGVCVKVDAQTGKSLSIERIAVCDEDISF